MRLRTPYQGRCNRPVLCGKMCALLAKNDSVGKSMNEWIPMNYFERTIRLWWVVALCAFLGGAAGYLLHLTRPPLYEATATFQVIIDFSKLGEQPLTQYDEDLALSVVEKILFYNPTIHEKMQAEPDFQAAGLDYFEWARNIRLERQHAFWKLRFRHADPAVAQTLVNRWAELGYQEMLAWEDAGKVHNYLVFSPPTLADLPQEPVVYGRNQMVLAGCLIGFIIGILLATWLGRKESRGAPGAAATHSDPEISQVG